MSVQFSVIIPCYNAARWIEATIQSVMNQTVAQSEIEIIVVDDGSKDNSISLIQTIPATNLRVIPISNHGVSYARNVGTAASNGQFIQYLDADDLLFPDALESRKLALIAESADVAYSRYKRLVEQADGEFVLGPVVGQKMEDVSPDLELAAFSSFWVPPVALMYRKSIVDKIGTWNRSLKVVEDARFLQDAAYLKAKFVCIDEALGAYRVHHRKDSLSKKNLDLFEQCVLKNSYQTEKRWQKNNQLTSARIDYLASTYKRSAEKFWGRDLCRFRYSYTAHRRWRKFWEFGLLDFCVAAQICFGAESRENFVQAGLALRSKFSLFKT